MANDGKPVLALVPGDPTGIGPEQLARILAEGRVESVARFLIVGDARVVAMGMRQAGVSLALSPVTPGAKIDWSGPAIPIIDLGNIDPDTFAIGSPDPRVGRLVGETLSAAVDLAKAGTVDAISFAPLNKQALFAGGWRFPDEHQLFAHLLGHRGMFKEMNVLNGWWMSRVASHVSMREALEQITFDRICAAVRLADETMRRAGVDRRRIAVTALNPARRGGRTLRTGRDRRSSRRAVQQMATEGICCSGPYPADTIYLKAFSGAIRQWSWPCITTRGKSRRN